MSANTLKWKVRRTRILEKQAPRRALYSPSCAFVFFWLKFSLQLEFYTDVHHLIPRSRCKEIGIEPNFRGNKINLPRVVHVAWHDVFENLMPEEVLHLICVKGFRPKARDKNQVAAWKTIFGNAKTTPELARIIVVQWSIYTINPRLWKSTIRKALKKHYGQPYADKIAQLFKLGLSFLLSLSLKYI